MFEKICSLLSRIPLLIYVVIAVGLGIGLGGVLPSSTIRIFITFNVVFGQYLGFCIPLIILGLIIDGIARQGERSGRLLLLTVLIAYGSTLFSGFFTFFSCARFFPGILSGYSIETLLEVQKTSADGTSAAGISADGASAVDLFSPLFTLSIPPVMDVMTALVLAFILGLGIATCRAKTLSAAAAELKTIIEKMIVYSVIPFLPVFIFGLFLSMSARGDDLVFLEIFGKVIGIIFALHVCLLVIQYVLAGLISGRNPFPLMWRMLPAYGMALGTSSSAATIPVTLAQVKRNGVRPSIADFCVPLCATIHLAGSMLKITAFSMTVVLLMGQSLSLSTYTSFIFLLAVTMVAAPGVPGGAIMAAAAVLKSVLGFDDNAVALMISLYIVTDCFGTAGNVCGDGAIAVVVDRFSSGREGNEPSIE